MNYSLIMAGRCCKECSKLQEVEDKHMYKGDMFSFLDRAASTLEEEKYRTSYDQDDKDLQAQFDIDYDNTAELLLDVRNLCDNCSGAEALIFAVIEKSYVGEVEFLIRSAQNERRQAAEKSERIEETKGTAVTDGKVTQVNFQPSIKRRGQR
jgi:hypothetical protein